MSEKQDPSLTKGIRQLAKKLAAVQKQAREMGIFVGDRELLTCGRCGLMEDVAFDGRLLTCRPDSLGEDTAFRFEELPDNRFQCPVCGTVIHLEEDKSQ